MISYVSELVTLYPYMKFQVNILSGSKDTDGDIPMDMLISPSCQMNAIPSSSAVRSFRLCVLRWLFNPARELHFLWQS